MKNQVNKPLTNHTSKVAVKLWLAQWRIYGERASGNDWNAPLNKNRNHYTKIKPLNKL